MIIIDSISNYNIFSYLNKLWQSKSLLWVFAKRNIKGKVAQTRLGIFTVLLQAIFLTIVFGLLVSHFITFPITYPYILFAVTGMMGWYIFSYVAVFSGTSVIQNHLLASKVYFPRIILPFSYGISVILDFLGWLLILTLLLIYYKIIPSINFLAIFIFLIIDIISGLAIGLWILLLSLRKRDVALFAPLITGIGMFFTPIFYPVKIFPAFLTDFIYLNPLAGVVEGFRWAIFNTNFDLRYIWGFSIIVLIFLFGIFLFVKKDGNMADNL
ncbi:MAG: ABC transporter permease [Bacteroidia bacterium]|nr:ABC transporter permease [Bacteroidia bacterium]